MIMAYGFAAAIRPVWRLLAPRDYPVRGRLRSHLCRSCVPRRLHHHQPAVPSRAFTPVASGTTPELLDSDALVSRVGYGAMIMASVVA